MFNISETLNKYNITEEKYEELLKECSDKICGLNELDWSEISEKYNLGFAGDTLRKAQQVPLVGGSFIREYYLKKAENNNKDDEYSTDIDNKIRKFQREQIKFRDERNAWNKQNYSDARTEQKLDYLEQVLSDIGKVNFVKSDIKINRTDDNEMIICISDLHIGQCFDNTFGKFDSNVARLRLNKYLDAIKENAILYNINNATILVLGDLISGNIHQSIQVTNRENVIDQIKVVSELITSFCYECTEIFKHVRMFNVSGNHSRIQNKDIAIHDERLDDLIGWIVSKILSNIDNFTYEKNHYDNGIASFDICGKSYIGVHGDYDCSSASISNLIFMLGYIPYGIFKGHLHYPSYTDVNGVKLIQSGSLVGSGDQYTIEKRLTGQASQTICICNKNGIKVHIPVEL